MPPRVRITRFPNWRALREQVAEEARKSPGSLLVLAPTPGARAALEDALRGLLLEPGRQAAELPEVRTPAQAIGDLLLRTEPPARLASPLERSLLMESALLDAARGAPRGNPLRLAGPLLRLFDEQSRDRAADPGKPAFPALLRRARRVFGEARETDEGAERLLRLTEWLERVHANYARRLAASERLDLEGARRRLLKERPTPAWAEIRILGDAATGIADNQVFDAVAPPGGLRFLLTEGDSAPALPAGWTSEEQLAEAQTHPAPRVFVPPLGETPLIRTTDRAGEARAAVAMLARYREEAGDGAFDRCAVAARNPDAYVDTLAASFEEAGIPFRTDFQPSLAETPWPAGLDDTLRFAERPGRLSCGFALLRSPFFRDDQLGDVPGRLADIAASALADIDIRDTHEPEALEELAERTQRLGDSILGKATGTLDERRGRELGVAARVIARLAAHARALAPIRDQETGFREAVECLLRFARSHFPDAPPAAREALLQAADPSLPETPSGGATRFRDRIRRQLRRHPTVRHPGRSGVRLIAAEDAPFGDYDCLILLGVGDADWPGPRPGTIFLPTRVLEDATRKRFAEAREREIRLLRSFADLPGKAAGFARAELEDGFPAGESPLFVHLEERLVGRERIPVAVPEPEPGDDVAPLPRSLDRSVPDAVDLAERTLSPSALVLYSRNPAQFFLERVLRLRREESLSDTASRTARGSRLHRLMEETAPAFFRLHGPVTEANLGDALAMFRENYQRMEDPGLTAEDRAAEELWLFGGPFHPSALEWFLREEADRGPVEPLWIEAELAGVVEPATDSLPPLRVRGIADRVDRTPKGVRILELKSGSSAGKDSALLQARLYARLAGAETLAVPFFRDREWVDGEKKREELDARIAAVRDGLAVGDFPAPADPRDILPFDWPLAIRPDLPKTPPEALPVASATVPPKPVAPAAARRRLPLFRPSDHEAREAAADPTRHVVLRASAGTGKTTVLTERYLNLIRAGVPPRNILALTFTRKAAAEMKDRIVQRLARPDFGDVRAERPDLGEVAVSTLDAFNLGLVREFPLDAGVAPGVEVLDEREMPALQQEAIRRVVSGASGFDRKTLAELPLLGRSLGSLENVAVSWLQNRLTWRSTFEDRDRRVADKPLPAPPTLRERLLPAQDAARQFLAGYQGPVPVPARLALRLEPQAGSRDALDREFLVEWLKPRVATAPRHVTQHARSVKPQYLRVKEAFAGFSRDWLDALNERAFPPVWRFLQAVESEYQALKEERGVMDFDDLTLAATRMLRNAGEFAESRFRLEARYHHLLLDEFQDTSDPQWELLRSIAEPWTSGEGLAAEEVRRVTGGRLETPTLFVVGDHKQSIYRFRNARVEILGNTETWIGARFRSARRPRVALRWNFRSTAPLRAFVNDVATAVAHADRQDVNWRFRYDEEDRIPEDPGPVDESSDENAPLSVASAEEHPEAARRIARRIQEIAASGAPLDEIAILSRRGNELETYRQAVEALGIPTCLIKGAGFFETSEVRDLTALCRFLARPHSDLRAVELLRSRFFAVPSRALQALRALDKDAETPFSDVLTSGGDIPLELPKADADPLREAGVRVAAWIGWSRELPPSLAVQRILKETGYLERARRSGAGSPFAGAQQAANVEKALQRLRRAERDGFATFEIAARCLETAGSDGQDATQAPLRAAGAVQVLTIHAAKGLEYEHVHLVDLNGRTPGAGGGVRVQEGDDGRWSISTISNSSDWDIRDDGRSSAEERRCLYVALTRAKRSLTLSGVARFLKSGALGKPQGLARFLPPDLWEAMAGAARDPRSEIQWARHQLRVLAD